MIPRKLAKSLEQQGFVFTRTKSSHMAVFKDGVRIGTMTRTPSDPRTVQNEISLLRKAGAIIPRKGERHR
jgi:hypothetical protein